MAEDDYEEFLESLGSEVPVVNIPREPSSDALQMGLVLFNIFTGLISAGFSEDQALHMVTEVMVEGVVVSSRDEEDDD